MLDTLLSLSSLPAIHFWRDRSQREIDFVLSRGRGACDAIECKWSPKAYDPRNLAAFRALHAKGANYLVAPYVADPYPLRRGELQVCVLGIPDLRRALEEA